MKYPKFIQKNAEVILVAPSFAASTEPYKTRVVSAIKSFEEAGYKILYDDSIFVDKIPYASDTKEERARRINEAFKGTAPLVFSVGGGEIMCEILDYLDYESIKANPKWYVGYSDNTILTFTLPTRLDIATIYGDCFGDLGQRPRHKSIDDLYKLITEEELTFHGYLGYESDNSSRKIEPLKPFIEDKPKIITATKNPLKASGRLIGGCLDIMSILCGTKFDYVKEFNKRYQEEKKIWFFDPCEHTPISLKRAIWQLKKAGWFENVSLFIFGRPGRISEDFGDYSFNTVILEELKEFGVPIIMDADIGHVKPSLPIITGAIGEITLTENDLTISYRLE